MPDQRKQIGFRPTWAEVNLDNIAFNFRQVRNKVGPGVSMMVTVKADAYGHGLVPVASKLADCGVDYLGVASIDEGIKLRQAGINTPILVLGLALKEDIRPVFKYDLRLTVCDFALANELNRKAARLDRPVIVHLKVDTGMGRIGVMHYDAFKLAKKINRLENIRIEGLFTHLAFADMNMDFTLYQIDLFARLVKKLDREKIIIPVIHAANSMGVLDYEGSHFNLVRPGLIVYGLYPKKKLNISLRPALSLKSRVVFVKRLPKNYGVSYGHEYITSRATRIATIPIGYGDGYPRNLSNKAPLLIRGRRFKIAGRVCMDQIMVDVGNFPVRPGDEVVLIGSQGRESVSAEELASLCGTIPYEIACGLGSRIPRVYI